MTQKEKLYKEFLVLYKEYLTLCNEIGKSTVSYGIGRPFDNKAEMDVDEYAETCEFVENASKMKVAGLKSNIEHVQESIDRLRKEVAVKRWAETEEGKAYMKVREEKIEALRQERIALHNENREETRKFVKYFLGEEFDLGTFCDSGMTIGLVKEYEDGKPKMYFGHTFDVYFDREFSEDKELRWELNYGTMGSFEIGKDANRGKYLVALAKFAVGGKEIELLKEQLHSYSAKSMEIQHQIWKLEGEMKNPKISA